MQFESKIMISLSCHFWVSKICFKWHNDYIRRVYYYHSHYTSKWDVVKRKTILLQQEFSTEKRCSHLPPSYWVLVESEIKAPRQPCQKRLVELLLLWVASPMVQHSGSAG